MKEKETNMKQVLVFAMSLLYMDMNETALSPVVVHHPYATSALVAGRGADGNLNFLNLMDKSDLDTWRGQMSLELEKLDSVLAFITLVTKPYLVSVYSHIRTYLSPADNAEVLRYVWTTSETPNMPVGMTHSQLITAFKKADKESLMDADERETWASLPEQVKVYRGVPDKAGKKGPKALSWTLDKERAKWFATRYEDTGVVWSGTIPKEYVHAYFDGESEAIIDYRHLEALQQERVSR